MANDQWIVVPVSSFWHVPLVSFSKKGAFLEVLKRAYQSILGKIVNDFISFIDPDTLY